MAFSRLVCAIFLTLYHKAHGTGRTSDRAHGGVEVGGRQVSFLRLGDLFQLLAGHLADLVGVRALEPEVTPAAFFSSVVAGVLLVMKVNVRSE